MIEISEALSWLNQFDKCHLNVISQQLIATAKNSRTADSAVQDALKAALSQAKGSPQDDLDYPEALLNCAAIKLDRGWKEQPAITARKPNSITKMGRICTARPLLYGCVELSP